jgi:rhomboid protease GluP
MTSQPPRNNDDDLNEAFGRLEREFQRPAPPPAPERAGVQRAPVQRAVPQRAPARRARVVIALLAINVVMYVVTILLSQRIGGPDPFSTALYVLGAKENAAIDAGQWWRLLTPMVLHGNLMHLLFNSYALYILGTDVEYVFGARRFLAIYLLAGLGGSMASYLFNPQSLSVGASGAIFGLLGALAARIFAARRVLGREALKMQLGQIASLVAINLVFGFLPGTNIDNSAHIGGLIVGTLCGLVLAPRYQAAQTYGGLSQFQQRENGVIGWLLLALIGIGLVAGFVALRLM